jgi:hypothetical protein
LQGTIVGLAATGAQRQNHYHANAEITTIPFSSISLSLRYIF